MKRSKLSVATITSILKDRTSGAKITDLCRKYKISRSTYYNLKERYAGMNGSDINRLRQLDGEIIRIKKMYADLSLDHTILQDVVKKKFGDLEE